MGMTGEEFDAHLAAQEQHDADEGSNIIVFPSEEEAKEFMKANLSPNSAVAGEPVSPEDQADFDLPKE